MLADALDTPVSVMATAGEGGAWGMALLAAYMIKGGGKTLPDWLDSEVFADIESSPPRPKLRASADLTNTLEDTRLRWRLKNYWEM